MNINKYINQLDSAKFDAMKSLNMISWPQSVPETNNSNVAPDPEKSSKNVTVPIVGGVGCASLVGGLVTSKIGLAILGGALMIGAFVLKKVKKPSQKVETESQEDFQELVQSLDKMIYENVKKASNQWDSAISSIHQGINQEILSSDVSESKKTDMLSVVSEEYPLLLSTMEISIQLQSLVSSGNINGMKKALGDYHDKCIENLHKAYESQVNVYKSLEK